MAREARRVARAHSAAQERDKRLPRVILLLMFRYAAMPPYVCQRHDELSAARCHFEAAYRCRFELLLSLYAPLHADAAMLRLYCCVIFIPRAADSAIF